MTPPFDGLSYRSQKLARAIEPHLTRYDSSYARRTTEQRISRFKAYLVDTYDYRLRPYFQKADDMWRGRSVAEFYKTVELFGFEMIGRFESFLNGHLVSVFGRLRDMAVFVVHSDGPIIVSTVLHQGSSSAITRGLLPEGSEMESGLRLYLELDAIHPEIQQDHVGPLHTEKGFVSPEIALIAKEEISRFYAYHHGERFVFSTSQTENLRIFGGGRLLALPKPWRERLKPSWTVSARVVDCLAGD